MPGKKKKAYTIPYTPHTTVLPPAANVIPLAPIRKEPVAADQQYLQCQQSVFLHTGCLGCIQPCWNAMYFQYIKITAQQDRTCNRSTTRVTFLPNIKEIIVLYIKHEPYDPCSMSQGKTQQAIGYLQIMQNKFNRPQMSIPLHSDKQYIFFPPS